MHLFFLFTLNSVISTMTTFGPPHVDQTPNEQRPNTHTPQAVVLFVCMYQHRVKKGKRGARACETEKNPSVSSPSPPPLHSRFASLSPCFARIVCGVVVCMYPISAITYIRSLDCCCLGLRQTAHRTVSQPERTHEGTHARTHTKHKHTHLHLGASPLI